MVYNKISLPYSADDESFEMALNNQWKLGFDHS